MLETLLFYFFALLTLAGAVATISRRNAVLSAMWLIATLLGVAGLFLLAGAEFLFAAQIILYIGGITLLFLFVIMLVHIDTSLRLARYQRSWPLSIAACAALAAQLVILLRQQPIDPAMPSGAARAATTEALADVLLAQYLLPFELVSVLLLVAIVGAVWLGQPRVPPVLEPAP